MLLWHDSLDYQPFFLTATYQGVSGITAGLQHEVGTKKCIGGTGGQLTLPLNPNDITCIVGFLFNLDVAGSPNDNQTLLEFKSQGGLPKVRVTCRTNSGTGFQLQFQRDGSDDFLLVSSVLPFRTWMFLEIKITFQQGQGSIIFRVDGVENNRVEGITTDPQTLLQWGTLTFHLRTIGTSGFAKMADLYVCDGSGTIKTHRTFLGKVFSSRLFPFVLHTETFEWGINPSGGYRLLVILGQSNAQGANTVPYADAMWRNPNPLLPIWNAPTGTFQPLQAGANATGIITQGLPAYASRFGPEMALAEQIATMIERSGSTAPSNFRLVKAAQDASTVLAGYPDFITWDPATPNSLFQRTVTELNLAVASLGGIGNITTIDYFWYQGESEGLTSTGLLPYPGDFFNQTFIILLTLANLFPVTSRVHVVKIHKSIPEFSPNQGELVRHRLALVHSLLGVAQGAFLDIDHLKTGPDKLHLDGRSTDNLGIQFFQEWIRYQKIGEWLTDEFLSSVDARWVGSNTLDKKAVFTQAIYNQLNLNHSPLLASTAHTFSESTSDGKKLQVRIGNQLHFEKTIPSVPAWTMDRVLNTKLFKPEDISSTITLSLV